MEVGGKGTKVGYGVGRTNREPVASRTFIVTERGW